MLLLHFELVIKNCVVETKCFVTKTEFVTGKAGDRQSFDKATRPTQKCVK